MHFHYGGFRAAFHVRRHVQGNRGTVRARCVRLAGCSGQRALCQRRLQRHSVCGRVRAVVYFHHRSYLLLQLQAQGANVRRNARLFSARSAVRRVDGLRRGCRRRVLPARYFRRKVERNAVCRQIFRRGVLCAHCRAFGSFCKSVCQKPSFRRGVRRGVQIYRGGFGLGGAVFRAVRAGRENRTGLRHANSVRNV